MTHALFYVLGAVQVGTLAWVLAERSARLEQERSLTAHAAELAALLRVTQRSSERLDEHHRDLNQLFASTNTKRKA